MNAVEHVVECYFRYCMKCFTMTDVKVLAGNNRQCDLLACDLKTGAQFHVESSVTHDLAWLSTEADLRNVFDKKFRGLPPQRAGTKTDHTKGKTYFDNTLETYRNVGFDPAKVQRVFVTWAVREDFELPEFLKGYSAQAGFNVQVWLFRDKILPELMAQISTGNYEDEVLRTLSLLQQYDVQVKQKQH